MNDEIKEQKTKRIIEKIEGLATYVTIPRELAIYNVNIDSQEAKLLIDYITNLQQENQKLKELCDKYEEEHSNEFQCWKRDRKELLDKRERIEKAIPMLKELNIKLKGILNTGIDIKELSDIEDTLNGRSDE